MQGGREVSHEGRGEVLDDGKRKEISDQVKHSMDKVMTARW